jgi:hypothetical protein
MQFHFILGPLIQDTVYSGMYTCIKRLVDCTLKMTAAYSSKTFVLINMMFLPHSNGITTHQHKTFKFHTGLFCGHSILIMCIFVVEVTLTFRTVFVTVLVVCNRINLKSLINMNNTVVIM